MPFETIHESDMRVPLRVWGRHLIRDNAIEQMKNVCRLSILKQPVCLMPDGHLGKGATIGSVIPTKNEIIPSAVGSDIGCGILAHMEKPSAEVKRNLKDLKGLRQQIEEQVPLGHKGHDKIPVHIESTFQIEVRDWLRHSNFLTPEHDQKSKNQLGTLGGGNHFIEISLDENENVWTLIHSGSRGLGKTIGDYFTNMATDSCKEDLPDKSLAYLSQPHEITLVL